MGDALKRAWVAFVGLALGACADPPRDACPGEPGCPTPTEKVVPQDGACPPRGLAPTVAWGALADAPSTLLGPAFVLDGRLAAFDDGRPGLATWSAETGWVADATAAPCGAVDAASTIDDATGDFYLAGGMTADVHLPVAEVCVRHGATGAWETLAPLPAGRAGATAIVHGGRLLVFGGRTLTTSGSQDALSYDVSAGAGGAWTPMNGLPEPRVYATGAVVGSFYHLLGGVTADVGHVLAISTLTLDLETGAWSSGAPIPTPRYHHAMWSTCDVLVVTGGLSSSRYALASTEVFDPLTRTWSEAPGAGLPEPHAAFGAAFLDGEVHLLVASGPGTGHRVGALTEWSR